jgi:hypothetical protein
LVRFLNIQCREDTPLMILQDGEFLRTQKELIL